MGTWVDISTPQFLILLFVGFVLTQIGELIAFHIHKRWMNRTGRRLVCQDLGCNFVITSNLPAVSEKTMEDHKQGAHLTQ